jgi:hypothetical protein
MIPGVIAWRGGKKDTSSYALSWTYPVLVSDGFASQVAPGNGYALSFGNEIPSYQVGLGIAPGAILLDAEEVVMKRTTVDDGGGYVSSIGLAATAVLKNVLVSRHLPMDDNSQCYSSSMSIVAGAVLKETLVGYTVDYEAGTGLIAQLGFAGTASLY